MAEVAATTVKTCPIVGPLRPMRRRARRIRPVQQVEKGGMRCKHDPAHPLSENLVAFDPPNLHALFIGEPGIGLRTLRSMLVGMEPDERDEGIEYPCLLPQTRAQIQLLVHNDASKPFPEEKKSCMFFIVVAFRHRRRSIDRRSCDEMDPLGSPSLPSLSFDYTGF